MIYALGSNGNGQLGIGHDEDVTIPTAVLLPEELRDAAVRRIVAGGNHAIFLFDNGTALRAGVMADDKAANEKTTSSGPTSISEGPYSDASATWSASFLVAADRRSVHVEGCGHHAELGLGRDVVSSTGSNITFPAAIRSIRSGLHHSVVILENGQVWGWGKGRHGQLQEPKENVWLPRQIHVDFKVAKAICGATWTCLLGLDGHLAMLGSATRDQFHLRADTPDRLPWTDAAASWSGIAIQTGDTVTSWGRDDRGQRLPKNLPPFKSMALGSEHWLVLTDDGQVLTGGWGSLERS